MSFSILPKHVLLRPRHIYGASSPEIFLEMQRASIVLKMASFPDLNWREPFLWTGRAADLKVSDSHWQLVCVEECGGFPAYDPEWQLAACFTCGAIYRQAPPPEWRDIERVLVARPSLINRHFLPGETLDSLIRENLEHGDPVPDDLKDMAHGVHRT